MPYPIVTQTRLVPSAVVTTSLALEVQVGRIPGAPGAVVRLGIATLLVLRRCAGACGPGFGPGGLDKVPGTGLPRSTNCNRAASPWPECAANGLAPRRSSG